MSDQTPPEEPTDRSKSPIARAVECAVYAPIGLFFEAPTLLPKLVEEGKAQARNARVFGKFAVEQGRAELRRRLGSLDEQASALMRAVGATRPSEPAAAPSPPAATPSPAPGDGARAAPPSPSVDELAITDYDSLAASQVVSRLAGLASDELEAVRAYESAHRGRKTILNKVAQLQS